MQKLGTFMSALALVLLCSAVVAQSPAAPAVTLSIKAQSMQEALNEFAQQTGLQVFFPTDEVLAGLKAPRISGTLTPETALKQLLAGSGLNYEFVNARTITIHASQSGASATAAPASSDLSPLRLVEGQTETSQPSTIPTGGAAFQQKPAEKIGEIIVTAQKKSERLQDVPVAMTVLDPVTLAENGQSRLLDYYATVPGLNVNSNTYGGGTQYLTLRGLSTGYSQNPTVAVVIDDVPTGSSSQLAFGMIASPDLDPSDLARIEVLKGPQGTLYGADSLGGVIKFVTQDPSPTSFSARTEISGLGIASGGMGYAVRGAANIPLSDRFAVRVSAFSRRDPGYIDNITTDHDNANSADVYGGRLAALWRPLDSLSLKFGALVQQTDGNGSAFVNYQLTPGGWLQPTNGERKQTGLPGTGPYKTQQQLYSLTAKADLAGLELTSVTGYGINKLDNHMDFTQAFGGVGGFSDQEFGVTGSNEEQRYQTDKFSQEVRVASSIGHWADWLVGGFYTNEDSPNTFQSYNANDLITGEQAGVMFFANYDPVNMSEHAVFGDLTVHVTDRFDLQFGGRQSSNRITYGSVFTGPLVANPAFYGESPHITPTKHASGNASTYLVTPSFKFTQDLMAYARIASGYRIGGPNLVTFAGVPDSYKPDKTTNYELGFKGDLLEHRISFDAAVYHIDWKDFQISVGYPITDTTGIFYESNAGRAKSEGLEASVQVRPGKGLTITAQGSFNNGVLAEDMPPAVVFGGAYGLEDDRLPYSVRWSGGLGANQDISLANGWTAFVGGALNYIGDSYGEFVADASQPRVRLPAYALLNLRAGASHDSWRINLYVNNAENRRGIVGALPATAVGVGGGYYASIIQPRTVGLSISKNW